MSGVADGLLDWQAMSQNIQTHLEANGFILTEWTIKFCDAIAQGVCEEVQPEIENIGGLGQ